MDVYFEAQQEFGSQLHIRPLFLFLFLFFLTTYEGASIASGLLAERYRLFRGLCTLQKVTWSFAVEALEVCSSLAELRRAGSVASPQRHSCTGKRFYNVLLSSVFYRCSEPVCLLAIEFLFPLFVSFYLLLFVFIPFCKTLCSWCKWSEILSPMSQLNCWSQDKV